MWPLRRKDLVMTRAHTGRCRAFTPTLIPRVVRARSGATLICRRRARIAVGALVGLELRRREHTIWPEARVQHFRTRRGAEVDFVVSVGQEPGDRGQSLASGRRARSERVRN